MLYDFVARRTIYPLANPTAGERMALVAVGGYGRGELAPFSDIDLLFLHPYKATPHTEQVVEYMLYTLWDMGLKVGQATRSVDETHRARQDRSHHPHRRARGALRLGRPGAVRRAEAPLRDRDHQGHRRAASSRRSSTSATSATRASAIRAIVVEPNVKEGKGGLRDLHTLFWIAKYIYRVDSIEELVERGVLSAEEAQRFARAQNFLWTVRCHLHFLTGRAEDRLTFDLQSEIGRRMGYTDHAGTRGVERFMKHYFLVAKDVGDLTRIFCALLETEQQRRAALLVAALGLAQAARSRASPSMTAGSTSPTSIAFRDDPVEFHPPLSRGAGARARHPSRMRSASSPSR